MENIRSFFQQEEALSAKPKPIPEAASEVVGRPKETPQPQTATRIVEKPLPAEQQRLPFSPEQLREALTKKETQSPVPNSPEPSPRFVEREIHSEIAAFEDALHDVHRVEAPRSQPTLPPPQLKVTDSGMIRGDAAREEIHDGFFGEFEQFLAREDLEADGIFEKDILFRMKEFHRKRQEGKEYYIYSKDMQQAVDRKLSELKQLEQEWFSLRGQADQIERHITTVEHDIEAHTTDLKELIRQAKAKSRLERRAPEGQEFLLGDGRKLASLLDLKLALRTMRPELFQRHVNGSKNDFAAWVRHAHNDSALADEIAALHDKTQLEVLLGKRTS